MSRSKSESHDLVSVVIPVFNVTQFLKEALSSVLGQDSVRTEIIVVDDGSDDGLKELAHDFPGLVWIRQEHRGSAAARNFGIIHAQGDFLAFLDADDLWTANKLSLQFQALREDPTVHLVAGQVDEFHISGSACNRRNSQRGIGQRAYTIGAILIRRTDFLRVGLFNEELQRGEFIDWHSRAMAAGIKERVLETIVLRRRIHGSNSSASVGHQKDDYLKVIYAHMQRNKRLAMPD